MVLDSKRRSWRFCPEGEWLWSRGSVRNSAHLKVDHTIVSSRRASGGARRVGEPVTGDAGEEQVGPESGGLLQRGPGTG
jgi:hypothetical protein